ncbi:probable inactive leucine-rich repeat receptor-like protein kinase At3g03770 [Mercurialis annua]|uniref:probable inactive leucine-rich repeat receptor-like protein kinase At3g03770 n=1 Tax=Mercurialis annua TaxID=3986 RepID=UPI00215F55C3|nr:probable inactive leucine-rich repeat receptor-like protein kinase At3g03770 [Mercurialis annua]
MGYCSWFLLSCLTWSFLILGTFQLQSSQTQVLVQLRKHLEYPFELEIWNDHTVDFCYLSSSTQVNVTCQDNVVTELRIIGDKPSHVVDNNFVGYAISTQTLSENFSMDSFVVTLARLGNLRVLSLVSLGIWGPLPDKIHRLSSLEFLDLSSNYLYGSVPPKISTMVKLQTLVLDHNFFNDTVPNWFDSLSNLTVLRLSNNKLKGSFPSSISKVVTLTDLVLSSNEISGKLPSLDTLTKLHVLDLSNNNLDSNLPSSPKGLVMAFLGNNSFSGEIPRKYSQLSDLQHLDLSFNELSGTPPAALFSLPNITYLNLASNMFTGSVADHLSCGSKLQFVDISNNSFTGKLPYCLSTDSGDRVVKFGGNCLSIDLHRQRAESSCVNLPLAVKNKEAGGRNVGVLVGVAAGTLIVVVILAFGFLIVCKKSRGISEQHLLHKAVQETSAPGFSSEILTNARYISEAAKLGTQGLPACRPFTLEELKEATRNFDDAIVLGEGYYGKLYKGRLQDGTQVAIRCLPSSKKYTTRNLKLRLDLLSRLRHPHLVCLLGHCIDGGGQDDYRVNKVFLVYEFVSNGKLQAHLYDDSQGNVLNWPERLTVVISIAKAVHFLHTGVIPGFFNNQLKTNNILLNEHGIAKLSDYGLSIISDEIGNFREGGEALKERQMVRLEDDVYSFGFILLESLLGRSVSARRDRLLVDEYLASCNSQESYRKIINPVVLATSTQESLSIIMSITSKCISCESWSRPSFEDILWNLQYAVQVQATADGMKI